ncbi:MAG: LysM peptidoglycan-binding domain-containing protein [Bacteroidetes bacterium]|nr:LysM peptidoglycan-binding domain-containing protein [Bacteroidota bacterium]MBS1739173.1 LysM peptidoglycan-binding domain-containing protein [Bacteroidota bacterium]
MRRILLFYTSLLISFYSFAQKKDSLFVIPDHGGMSIEYIAKTGETVFSIARKFHVPPAILTDANDFSFQQNLSNGTRVIVPLGAYNLLNAEPVNNEAQPYYYRITSEVKPSKIAKYTSASWVTVQRWNHLTTSDLKMGQTLLLGWVMYDATPMTLPKPTPETTRLKVVEEDMNPRTKKTSEVVYVKPVSDSAKPNPDTVSEGEQLFLSQTNQGGSVFEEKGTAAFFKRAGRSTNGIYFAFHNNARRGAILKIFSPVSGKTIYAKVIGTVPNTAVFHNALIGISSDARIALGARSNKLWCEVSYAP